MLGEIPLKFLVIVGISHDANLEVIFDLSKGFESCLLSKFGLAIEPDLFNGVLLRSIGSQSNESKGPLLGWQLPVDFTEVVFHQLAAMIGSVVPDYPHLFVEVVGL